MRCQSTGRLILIAKKPKPAKFPKSLITIGDHIRSRRLELRLTQAQVAKIIGVTEFTVTNWEKNHTEPMLWTLPKIIEFLDYKPNLQPSQTLGQKIKAYRSMRGISQEELAHQLGVDSTTLGRWERDEYLPKGKLKRRLESFFQTI